MATLAGMSGTDVTAMTAELSALLPLWIGKIYQYDNATFGIRLNGEDKARYLLYVVKGVRAHLVSSLPDAPKNPSGFSMYLRKFIDGGKVLAIEQKTVERVLIISIGKGPREFRLIIELFDEGNLILTDEKYVIQNALVQKRFRERDIVGGAVYSMEGMDPVRLSYEEFAEQMSQDEADVVRALATRMQLGGPVSEEVCALAGVSKSMPAKFATEVQLRPVYEAMVSYLGRLRREMDPVIDEKGAFPLPSVLREPKEHYPTFSAALEAWFPKPVAEAVVEAKVKLSREERIRKQQEEALVKFERKIFEAMESSEIIYSHYGEVQETINVLSQASERMSWQDIAKVLKGSDMPAARRIVSVNPADASVVLDLGEKHRVTIFVHESLEANVGRYYQVAKKFRAKKEGALRAMERAIVHPAKPKSHGPGKMKAKWYHRFRWMETSDGVVVIGGRNADQNEELVKKYMEGKDTFLHADVFGASVVIVKGTTEHMDEAVQFAASYSRLWGSGAAAGDVIAAAPSQVSKTAESGEFVAHGSFVIRGERKIFRNVPMEVAIGVQMEPVVAVLGGTPSAIEPRCQVAVRLRPGTFEGNDVAKKVLRRLKEGLPESDQKLLKAVLNTEAVAAFVPPGGSDLVES
ncbi:MAG TPA: ribosome rescue protein RqcH [Methanocorpusculum sp.]|nr:ribosome rescue protein RqcH [Methanocorpusculum sp.]HJK21556.1 ribosome rescue protein RqcH [Methanocorpusculum sp.]HJK25819.1 ribosome rescue protein RqcH [Methanocorpusculum sp.]HJK26008.1 ribosome rescue protein RqcH [Methanocorpusculum sp.]HJK33695.1 ribosome rescue protein RqcH [Methanocorpusculum sp.]